MSRPNLVIEDADLARILKVLSAIVGLRAKAMDGERARKAMQLSRDLRQFRRDMEWAKTPGKGDDGKA